MTGRAATVGRFAIAYVVALVVLVALDALWLGWLARDFYRREMAEVMAASPRLAPAAVFYLLYPLGLVFLGLMPWPRNTLRAAGWCAAVGVFAYGTYDLTNLSVMRGWSVELSLVDSVWGTFASALAGSIAYGIASRAR
jgi:uncharacterized membrane protein